jgi:hypothetical protein
LDASQLGLQTRSQLVNAQCNENAIDEYTMNGKITQEHRQIRFRPENLVMSKELTCVMLAVSDNTPYTNAITRKFGH